MSWTPLQWFHNIKNTTFFWENHGFWAPEIFLSPQPIWTFTVKKVGYVRSRTTERIVTWVLIIFFVRTPHSDHFGPPFFWLGKIAKPAFEGTWKTSYKTVKNSLFGHLMHSIASLLPGLLYRIQIWDHRHHYSGFPISNKKNTFFVAKITVFGHPRFFLNSGPIWTFTGKRWGMLDLELQSKLWRASWFFFRNVGVKIRRNRPTWLLLLFWSGHPASTIFDPLFLAGKSS